PLRRNRQKAVIGGQDGNQVDVRARRQIGLILPLAVGDDVINRRKPHVVGTRDQVRELVGRARREIDLDVNFFSGKQALPLRHPNRQVETAREVDNGYGFGRVGGRFTCV